MNDQSAPSFDAWAIVEIMGHVRLAGKVTEQVIAGGPMLRIDVPQVNGQPGFSRFYGQGAIYSITPVDESIARAAVQTLRAQPVTVYIPAQLMAPDDDLPDWPDDDDDNSWAEDEGWDDDDAEVFGIENPEEPVAP